MTTSSEPLAPAGASDPSPTSMRLRVPRHPSRNPARPQSGPALGLTRSPTPSRHRRSGRVNTYWGWRAGPSSEKARAQRLAVGLAQRHPHAGLLSRRQKAGPDIGIKLHLCPIQSSESSPTSRGGASPGAAASRRPSKPSRPVPVNPRYRIRRLCSNLASAFSGAGIPLQNNQRSPL